MGLVRSTADVHVIDEYEVKVGIEWGGSEPLLIYTHDNSGQPYSGVSTSLASYTAVESTVIALSSETDFRDQVLRLGEDCVNQGGITHLQSIRTSW